MTVSIRKINPHLKIPTRKDLIQLFLKKLNLLPFKILNLYEAWQFLIKTSILPVHVYVYTYIFVLSVRNRYQFYTVDQQHIGLKQTENYRVVIFLREQ